MIVAMDQPAETDLRIVEKILAPEILRAFDRHAARHRADHRHLSFRHFADCAERNQRLKPGFSRAFRNFNWPWLTSSNELQFGQVTRSVLSGARSSRGPAQFGQLKCAAAYATLFTFGRARRGDAEFSKRDLLAQEDEWRRLVVIECSESVVHAGEIGVVVSLARR